MLSLCSRMARARSVRCAISNSQHGRTTGCPSTPLPSWHFCAESRPATHLTPAPLWSTAGVHSAAPAYPLPGLPRPALCPDHGICSHSAGVGRTGCFIVIDAMLERIKTEKTVDVYGHVTLMRSQRNYMVQTEDQYSFIHEALLEAVGCGNTEVPARSLYTYIQKLAQVEPGEHVTGMELEFKVTADSLKLPSDLFIHLIHTVNKVGSPLQLPHCGPDHPASGPHRGSPAPRHILHASSPPACLATSLRTAW